MYRTTPIAALAALIGCSSPAATTSAASSTNRSELVTETPSIPQSRRTHVLDSTIAHLEQGRGAPVVFLHGNPLSSRVWRKVLPELSGHGRLLAPDLIGMGESGKPNIAYRFTDHARYLEAWLDALALTDVVLVGHDWGGVLALDWARRNPERVRGVAVLETIIEGLRFSQYPPPAEAMFRALRTPGQGEAMVLERNEFLGKSLENGVKSGLSEAERAAYYAPFPDAASRRPMLQWTRELPIDGEPGDVLAVVDDNARWLEQSSTIPKLVLTFEAAPLSQGSRLAAWIQSPPARLNVVALGPAGHHAPEDAPLDIAAALREWLPPTKR
ncbi:MAG: alpha/beta fold family hydrolase [Polyangiaceae bacterium]|jgi:haloalkane dehalogenase|nr:alpha/beta fold family hydrolase [Polyangiaceae bacterium]